MASSCSSVSESNSKHYSIYVTKLTENQMTVSIITAEYLRRIETEAGH